MPTDLGPIRVSPNGRHFVTSDGAPFFWLGDTQWELVRSFSLDDARLILEDRKAKGFTVLQVMLAGVGDGTSPNFAGELPWLNNDPATPNERYLGRVDEVIALSREIGLVLVLGVYHQLHESRITPTNVREYAARIARRYADVPNLIWTTYPRAEAQFVPVLCELAAGLREGDGGAHLINVHPDPAPASSSFLQDEPWLDFHALQTHKFTDLIRPMIAADCAREPARPVVMAEGAYEGGPDNAFEYGFEVTPLWVRRQAWWTCLAGGHHTYGHGANYLLPPDWRDSLRAPGATHMGIMREVLESLPEWWNLVPDQSLIARCEAGDPTMNASARAADGSCGLIYLGGAATIAVCTETLAAADEIATTWISPTTGERLPASAERSAGVSVVTTPAGWEDALLLLEPCS